MSDTEFKRLFQPASSTGCFSQRDKTVGINDRAVDGSSDCDVMAVAVFLFLGWFMHVLLSLTIRFPHRDVIKFAKMGGLLQPRPTCVAPATDKLTTVAALIYSVV